MSQLFNEREQAFENKYAHEAENEFLVRTRGGAMFVQWLAGLLKLDVETAAVQGNRMLSALMEGQNEKAILGVVAAELAQAGLAMPVRDLTAQLTQCQADARRALYAS